MIDPKHQGRRAILYTAILGLAVLTRADVNGRASPAEIQGEMTAQDTFDGLGTVSGTLSLDGFKANSRGLGLRLEVQKAGQIVETLRTNFGDNKVFGFAPKTSGKVMLRFSFRSGLVKAIPATLGSTPIRDLKIVLTNGDVDRHNAVNIVDYAILSDAFDTVKGDEWYDDRADLDGNQAVNINDYAILSDNMGKVGD